MIGSIYQDMVKAYFNGGNAKDKSPDMLKKSLDVIKDFLDEKEIKEDVTIPDQFKKIDQNSAR